jgi:ATP-dependent Zn protease
MPVKDTADRDSLRGVSDDVELAWPSQTSDATVHLIEEEVRRILAGALDGARRCIEENRAVLDLFATALLEHETLDKPEIARLLGTSSAALRRISAS